MRLCSVNWEVGGIKSNFSIPIPIPIAIVILLVEVYVLESVLKWTGPPFLCVVGEGVNLHLTFPAVKNHLKPVFAMGQK